MGESRLRNAKTCLMANVSAGVFQAGSNFIPTSDFEKICPEKGKTLRGISIYEYQPLQVGLYANHPSGLMLKQLSDPPTNPPDSQIWKKT